MNAIDSKKKKIGLLAAASKGHTECIRILLQAGADVNAIGYKNHTALTLSCLHRRCESVQLLIESGADVNLSLDHGAALHVAVSEGSLTIVNILLRAGANVNVVDLDYQTALMVAVMKGNLGCVKLLFQAGAEVRRDRYGYYALRCLQQLCDENIITLLDAAGETNELNVLLSDDDPTLCLKDICRRTIREHLLQMSRVNQFVRVPYLGLPSSLARYLLYDVSLD